MKIMEKLKQRVNERRLIEAELPKFPSPTNFLTDEERMVLSGMQSRSMKLWWNSLSLEQRKEMARRISEGHARKKTKRKHSA